MIIILLIMQCCHLLWNFLDTRFFGIPGHSLASIVQHLCIKHDKRLYFCMSGYQQIYILKRSERFRKTRAVSLNTWPDPLVSHRIVQGSVQSMIPSQGMNSCPLDSSYSPSIIYWNCDNNMNFLSPAMNVLLFPDCCCNCNPVHFSTSSSHLCLLPLD